MITIVFGMPGVGKSAFMTANAARYMLGSSARQLYEQTCREVERLNERFATDTFIYKYPAHVPVYSNYSVRVPTGYKKVTKTYWIDGFHFGFEHGDPKKNKEDRVVFVYPGSKVFLCEGQRYYDSRKRGIPDWVSRYFEEHRHFGLDIFIDVQRPSLIDANIREISSRFVLVEGFEQLRDKNGYVSETVFHYKEFPDWNHAEAFMDAGVVAKNTYSQKKESFSFDVFKMYNSLSYYDSFLPSEGKNFAHLENFDFVTEDIDLDLAKRMYTQSAPKGYFNGDK